MTPGQLQIAHDIRAAVQTRIDMGQCSACGASPVTRAGGLGPPHRMLEFPAITVDDRLFEFGDDPSKISYRRIQYPWCGSATCQEWLDRQYKLGWLPYCPPIEVPDLLTYTLAVVRERYHGRQALELSQATGGAYVLARLDDGLWLKILKNGAVVENPTEAGLRSRR